MLEQIRILSNLETDKEKLLQIILVGQLNLQALLRSPELRQLDQRVSIRYELKPLDQETVAAYVAHRLTIAGGSASVTFTAKALTSVHRFSGGIPRLINLICDRALLAGFSARANRITPEMVKRAAESLDLQTLSVGRLHWPKHRAPLAVGAVVVLLASAISVGVTAWLYERFDVGRLQASAASPTSPATGGYRPGETSENPALTDGTSTRAMSVGSAERDRALPASATLTILAGSYPQTTASASEIQSMTEWLEASGYPVYYARVDHGVDGRWQRVLAGAYADPEAAALAAARLRAAAPGLEVRVVTSVAATGIPGELDSGCPPPQVRARGERRSGRTGRSNRSSARHARVSEGDLAAGFRGRSSFSAALAALAAGFAGIAILIYFLAASPETRIAAVTPPAATRPATLPPAAPPHAPIAGFPNCGAATSGHGGARAEGTGCREPGRGDFETAGSVASDHVGGDFSGQASDPGSDASGAALSGGQACCVFTGVRVSVFRWPEPDASPAGHPAAPASVTPGQPGQAFCTACARDNVASGGRPRRSRRERPRSRHRRRPTRVAGRP